MKNTFVKVLSFLMALTMIVGTLGTVVVFAADCTHENATAGEVVAPKCNAVGYTWYTCDDCGASFKGDYVPVTGEHVLVEGFKNGQSAEATCTTQGYIAGKKCTDCNTWIVDPVPNPKKLPTGHKFAAGTITEKKYCTDAVYLVFNCTGCGKASHDLAAGDTAGTFAPVPGNVNSYPARTELEPAGTCDWGEYVVKTTPVLACDSTVVERTCKVCAKVETHTTPVTHKWLTWTAAAKVTGYVEGEYCGEYLSYKYCDFCGTKTEVKTNPDRNKHGKTVVATMTADLRNNATFVAWCNANGKNYLNLADGATIGSGASCAKAGSVVYYCAHCNTYREEPLPQTAHEFEYYTKTVTDATKCVQAVVLMKRCKNAATCKYKDAQVSVVTPAVEHVSVKDTAKTKAATCTTSGVNATKCATCGKSLSTTYTPAKGHTWGEYYNSDADGKKISTKSCVDGIYQARACTVAGCGEIDTVVTILKPTGAHTWSTGSDYKVRPATCSDGEWGYYYCKNGDCAVNGAEVTGTRDDDKRNAANHVPFVDTDTGFVQLEGKYVAPTCTEKGKITYICKCGAELTHDVKAAGHKPVEAFVGQFDFNHDGTIDLKVDVTAVAPMCNVEGFKAGKACSVCGTITTPRVSLGKKATAHSADPTVVKTHAATCLADGYEELRYDKCCDLKTTRKTGETKLTSCATATLKAYTITAPTCTENGYHTYTICTVCNKVASASVADCTYGKCSAESHRILTEKINAGVITEAELQIAATGHNFTNKTTNKVAAVPATCETDGHTEYYYCLNNCGQHTAYTILRAHKTTLKEYKQQDATCFAPGIKEGWYCPICIDIKGSVTYNAARIPQRDHEFTEIIPVNVQDYDRATMKITKSVDCTKPAYFLKKCTCTAPACGYIVMYEETFVAAKANHNWSVVLNEHNVVDEEREIVAGETYACWASGYTSKNCADCGQESEKTSMNNQIKHYYYVAGEKVEIDLSCDNISKYEGVRCALCGNEVKATEDAKETYVKGEYLGSVHTYKQDKVNAKYDETNAKWIPTSCTEYGYVSEYCVVCKKDKVDTVTVNPYNPTLNPYNKDGSERADIIKAIVDKKAATAGAAGYVKYVCAYCNETHNYVLPALGGLEFSVIPSASKVAAGTKLDLVVKVKANADVAFNSLVLNLNLGNLFTIAGEPTLNYTFAGSNMVLDASASSVKIYAEHDANGKPVNVTIKAGEVVEFITVTVEANEFANGTSGELEATLSNVVKYKADGKTTEDVDVSVSKGAKNKVTVCGVGNLNGDATIAGVSDIQQLIHLVYNESTDAIADINRDGVVNGKDITALRTFSTSAQKALDYITMIGVDLDAAIAAANVPNMDKNGVIDVNDEILFANAIKNELAAMTCAEYFAKNYASIDDCILSLTIKLITPVTLASVN